MRVIKFLLGAAVLCVAVMVVVGYRLPENHTASREREFAYPVDRVFHEIATPVAYPKWRSGVQKVDLLPDSDGVKRFRESSMRGDVTYAIEETIPNKLYVIRIADAALPYSGSWTYELTPTGAGTSVRITEDGSVHNPVFRFISRYVMGHFRTIDGYLADLDKRLAAPITT